MTSFAGNTIKRSGVVPVLLLALVIGIGLPLALPAQQTEFIDREPEIKAAYLYNFARYVEWPATAESKEFVIGVVGETPIAGPLTIVSGQLN